MGDGIQESVTIRMSFFTHFRTLFSLVVSTILFTCLLFWFNFEKDAVKIFVLFWGINAIPTLYLHFEYWVRNWGEVFILKRNEIIFIKGKQEYRYKNVDIEKVVIVLTPSLNRKNTIFLLSMTDYHYVKIKLKSGGELILTCLLSSRLDQTILILKGVLFEREEKYFCSLY